MGGRQDFGTGTIDWDPKFYFLTKINSNEDEDEDFLFNNPDYSPYLENDFTCTYIGTDHFSKINLADKISVLSLNIQSLPAKFNELNDMLNELSTSNFTPEIICLQETWQIPDPLLYQLSNYQLLESNTRINTWGGRSRYFRKKWYQL